MLEPNEFGYSDFRFAWGDHICAVFDDRAQQMEVMGSFITAGLRAVQRCVWVAPEESGEALREELADRGGDLATLESSSQLLIIPEVEFYLQGGVFEPRRTMDLVAAILEDNRREGYEGTRFANDVSWLSDGRLSAEQWEKFETGVTGQIAKLPMVMVCQYDRRQVSGSLVITALRTHPAVILGDVFQQNPFYAAEGDFAPDARDIM